MLLLLLFTASARQRRRVDGILQFYRSPVGQTMLSKTAQLTEESIAISQRRMTEIAPEIQKLIDEFMRQMS